MVCHCAKKCIRLTSCSLACIYSYVVAICRSSGKFRPMDTVVHSQAGCERRPARLFSARKFRVVLFAVQPFRGYTFAKFQFQSSNEQPTAGTTVNLSDNSNVLRLLIELNGLFSQSGLIPSGANLLASRNTILL